MSSRPTRAIGVLILASVLVMSFPEAGAQPAADTATDPVAPGPDAAEPTPAPLAPTPATRSEVESRSYDEAWIGSAQETLGLGREQALDRLRLEDASKILPEVLPRVLGESFAGLWLTLDDPAKVVVLSTDEHQTADAVAKLLRGSYAHPERIEVRHANQSKSELEEQFTSLVRERERIETDGLATPLSFTGGAYSVNENVFANLVEVIVSAPLPSHIDAAQLERSLLEHYGFEVGVVVGDSGPTQAYCSRSNCQWEMMGGLRLDHGTDSPCTSGFPVLVGTGSQRAATTAGHCFGDEVVGQWRRNGPNSHIGKADRDVVRGNCDAEDTSPDQPVGILVMDPHGRRDAEPARHRLRQRLPQLPRGNLGRHVRERDGYLRCGARADHLHQLCAQVGRLLLRLHRRRLLQQGRGQRRPRLQEQ